MTCSGSQALLAIPAERLRRPLAVPSEQARSHGNLRLRRDGGGMTSLPKRKRATPKRGGPFAFRSLAMTYSHMGRPHTTIGDASFHF